MELRPVTGGALRDWYDQELTQAFPPNECKPLADIKALMDQGRYEVWGLFDGETLLGYATLWMEPGDKSCILLDYLGVTAARRKSGCWRSGWRESPCCSLRRSGQWKGTIWRRMRYGSGGFGFMSGAVLCLPTIWPPVG